MARFYKKKSLLSEVLLNHQKVSCFLLGGIGGLSFAPIQNFLFLIPSFSCFLFILIKESHGKKRFLKGWLFGCGHFFISTFWIPFSFYYVNLIYFIPFVICILSSLLALFPGIVAYLFTPSPSNTQNVILFSILWSLSEWLRGHLLTGFPWNLLGYVWGIELLQITAWIGIYGLSFLTIWCACVFLTKNKKLICSSMVLLGALWAFGFLRLLYTPTHYHDHIIVRLVQPCIAQNEKWQLELGDYNLWQHEKLSALNTPSQPSIIIWSEAALPYNIYDPLLRKRLKNYIPKNGFLITGAPRFIKTEFTQEVFSSLFVLNDEGKVISFYDKSHLVPFGEYMPFKKYLPFKKLTAGNLDYSEGTGITSIKIPSLPPFSPLICYEAIFPNKVSKKDYRPEWLLNITNDAWYGNSSGPYQHLAIARVRSIEEGLPLVRTANNGISAVIDGCGRILASLELNKIGVIDHPLPKALPKTFHSRVENLLYFLFILAYIVFKYCSILRQKIHET